MSFQPIFARKENINNDFIYKKLLNKVVMFVELRLNPWCHMDYFNKVLSTFLGLECVSCVAVYADSEDFKFNQKYLHLCSKEERTSYGFWATWGWVINDRILIFGWTLPLIMWSFSTYNCEEAGLLEMESAVVWSCTEEDAVCML